MHLDHTHGPAAVSADARGRRLAARPAHRARRARRVRQDRDRRRALPGAAGRAVPRRRHQRHLHPRGRRVPAAGGRAAARADHGRRDGRLSAHRDPGRHLRQPRSRGGSGGRRRAARPDPGRVRRATTSPPPSPRGSSTRQIFVIDVAGGDDIPRKGGPGVTTADCWSINKTDLAPYVGSDLARMAADAKARRAELPVVFRRCAATAASRTSPRGCGRSSPPGRRDMSGVHATARIRASADGRGGTSLPVLESDGPLALRRTRATGDRGARHCSSAR